MTTLKTKVQIVAAIEKVTNDAAHRELMFNLNNWTSFNSEKFTPTRYAERMLIYGKRLIDLGNIDKGKAIINLATDIL
jgi:hypothetical protein